MIDHKRVVMEIDQLFLSNFVLSHKICTVKYAMVQTTHDRNEFEDRNDGVRFGGKGAGKNHAAEILAKLELLSCSYLQ
jgi:hypothetical protein